MTQRDKLGLKSDGANNNDNDGHINDNNNGYNIGCKDDTFDIATDDDYQTYNWTHHPLTAECWYRIAAHPIFSSYAYEDEDEYS